MKKNTKNVKISDLSGFKDICSNELLKGGKGGCNDKVITRGPMFGPSCPIK